MKNLIVILLLPFVFASCATYNDREFAEVYNIDYRPYIEKPFDDMVDKANEPTVEGYGLDGKDAMKAVVKTRTDTKDSNTIRGNGINITLQQ